MGNDINIIAKAGEALVDLARRCHDEQDRALKRISDLRVRLGAAEAEDTYEIKYCTQELEDADAEAKAWQSIEAWIRSGRFFNEEV